MRFTLLPTLGLSLLLSVAALAEEPRATLLVGAPTSAGLETSIHAVKTVGVCVAGPNTLCLAEDRFSVRVTWKDFDDTTGMGTVLPFQTNDSGLLWFFTADNWEMLVKVLPGCAFNGHFWVFASASTDVEYVLRVTDHLAGVVKEYRNPPGNAAAAITDTAAI